MYLIEHRNTTFCSTGSNRETLVLPKDNSFESNSTSESKLHPLCELIFVHSHFVQRFLMKLDLNRASCVIRRSVIGSEIFVKTLVYALYKLFVFGRIFFSLSFLLTVLLYECRLSLSSTTG